MTSQTFLTVAEAAVRVNKSRQTLFEKIKRGQLSATVNADGHKVIDVSELLRVFGTLLSDEQVQKNLADRSGQPSASSLTTTLQLELELAKMRQLHAEKELATANRQLEEMRVRERQSIEDRTQLLNVIERQTLLLAAPAPVKAKAMPVAKPKPVEKSKVAPPAKKSVQVRKAAPAKPVANTVARSKPVAKTVTRTATKKATKK